MEDSQKPPEQQELKIQVPEQDKSTKQPESQPNIQNQQNNFYLNIPQVELPPADEFNKYSPEVRDFWLKGAAKEQDARHLWIEKEQDMRATALQGARSQKSLSMILGTFLAVSFMGLGTF